jgi:hypothetical protein
MAKQVAPERHEICEVVATLLAHAGGMNEPIPEDSTN